MGGEEQNPSTNDRRKSESEGKSDGGYDAGLGREAALGLEPALEVDACKLLGPPFLMQNRPFGVLAKRSDEYLTARLMYLTAQPGRGYLAISFYPCGRWFGGRRMGQGVREGGEADSQGG